MDHRTRFLGAYEDDNNSVSVLYCLTTSLVQGGEGLGTAGFHETKVRELCAEAGLSSVRRVPLDDPFNSLYEITP